MRLRDRKPDTFTSAERKICAVGTRQWKVFRVRSRIRGDG
jgi:hypothetical protein